MDVLAVHGYLDMPGRGHVDVDVCLHDWPAADTDYPFTWNAVLTGSPRLVVGTEGELHIDTENTDHGHPCVVIASTDRHTQVRGHENQARALAPERESPPTPPHTAFE
ncbi:hypothetical protein [Embleya scabrispora]|uniref:hypothetical protein n=1 Tax=Embleya scabrispora TaxID=159449 RepID=UPI001912EBA3|nr:hypothetical protein [Embleya scabrispora]